MSHSLHKLISFWVFFSLQTYLIGQTFSGQGGLPFPPSGTQGITNSAATVSGVGVLGGCKKIEKVVVDLLHLHAIQF